KNANERMETSNPSQSPIVDTSRNRDRRRDQLSIGPPSHPRYGADMLWRRVRAGRILAVKWGMNPNSSSLGVDVTFLLFGMAAVALLTPIVSLFLRARRAGKALPPADNA